MDLFWWVIIAVSAAVAIAALNIYNAYRSGFFGWVRRKREPTVNWFKTHRKQIVIVVSWSLVVAILMMKSYWLVFERDPRAFQAGIAYSDVSQWMPRLESLDYLIIIIAAFIAGVLLLDLYRIFVAFAANIILSYIFAITYICYFLWYPLRWDQLTFLGGWWQLGWQYSVYTSLMIVFRMSFPVVLIISFMAASIGGIARAIVQPSAENGN